MVDPAVIDDYLTEAGASPEEIPQAIAISGAVQSAQAKGIQFTDPNTGAVDMQSLIQSVQAEKSQAEKIGLDLLSKVNNQQQLSKVELLGMALAAALTTAAGAALGGKKGALAGAAGGFAGGVTTLKARELEQQQTNAATRLQAKTQLDRAADLGREQQALEKEQRQILAKPAELQAQADKELYVAAEKKKRGLLRNTNINIQNVPEKSLDRISTRDTLISEIQKVISFAETKLRKEDGSFIDVGARKYNELKPDSAEREFAAKLEDLKIKTAAAEVTGAASDKDQVRIDQSISGGTLAALPLIIRRLEDYRDSKLNEAFLDVNTLNRAFDSRVDPKRYLNIHDFLSADARDRGEEYTGSKSESLSGKDLTIGNIKVRIK